MGKLFAPLFILYEKCNKALQQYFVLRGKSLDDCYEEGRKSYPHHFVNVDMSQKQRLEWNRGFRDAEFLHFDE